MRRSTLFGGLLILLPISTAICAEPDTNLELALGLVNQALQAEIDGDLLGRERLLNESEHAAPLCPPANWFSGRMQNDAGKWVTVDETIERAQLNQQLDEYEAMRAQQPASVQGNWQAAQWCAQQGMAAQCRAHLENMIVLDHDNAAARKILGHTLVGEHWLTPDDQLRLAQRAEFSRAGFAKYQQPVTELMAKISQGKSSVSKSALEQLHVIDDPQAIPVMEAAALQFSGQAAVQVAHWLGRMDHQEAALSLARLALTSANGSIHQAAVANLKQKSLYDFVPELLAAMSSPIMLTTVPVMNAQGNVAGFRQMFAREGAEEHRVLQLDTSVMNQFVRLHRPVATRTPMTSLELLSEDRTQPFGQRRTYRKTTIDSTTVSAEAEVLYAASLAEAAICEAVAKMNIIASVHNRQARAEIENQQVAQFNNRIAQVLSEVSGVEFARVPHDVWDWWDRYNKTDYQKSKIQRQRYQNERFSIPRFQDSPTASPFADRTYEIFKASCFVAGTQVATLRGPRNIESIMPGDLVLSRHIRTGELCYQPVICGTRRAPTQTVILNVDNDTIHATRSHLLWVSGKGWTQAGDIQPGDLLHAAAEPAVVMSTKLSDERPTYNLIVMDTHTYFVGTSRILSHDVLPRGSVHEAIPGEFALASTAP
jgi:hypothetical protein